jgi:hypothetical protein
MTRDFHDQASRSSKALRSAKRHPRAQHKKP